MLQKRIIKKERKEKQQFVVDKIDASAQLARKGKYGESRLIGSGEPRRARLEMSLYDTLWHTRSQPNLTALICEFIGARRDTRSLHVLQLRHLRINSGFRVHYGEPSQAFAGNERFGSDNFSFVIPFTYRSTLPTVSSKFLG